MPKSAPRARRSSEKEAASHAKIKGPSELISAKCPMPLVEAINLAANNPDLPYDHNTSNLVRDALSQHVEHLAKNPLLGADKRFQELVRVLQDAREIEAAVAYQDAILRLIDDLEFLEVNEATRPLVMKKAQEVTARYEEPYRTRIADAYEKALQGKPTLRTVRPWEQE